MGSKERGIVYVSGGTNVPKKKRKALDFIAEIIKREGNLLAYSKLEAQARKWAQKVSWKKYFDTFIYDGSLVLHYAASKNLLMLTDVLVSILGVSIHLQDEAGSGLLHYAIQDEDNTSKTYVSTLVEFYKADVNLANLNGTTPLHVSVFKGNALVTKTLLSIGADISRESFYGKAIHISCAKDDVRVLRELIECGADVNETYYFFLNPLSVAVYYGSINCLKELIKTGADIHAKQLLAKAIVADVPATEEMVRILIQNGADANCFDEMNHEELPIILAAKRGQWKVVELLLEHTEPIPGVTWKLEGIVNYIQADTFTNQDLAARKKRTDALQGRAKSSAKRGNYLVSEISCKALKWDLDEETLDFYENLCKFSIWYATDIGKVNLDHAKLYGLGATLSTKKAFARSIMVTKALLALDPSHDGARRLLKEVKDADEGASTSSRA